MVIHMKMFAIIGLSLATAFSSVVPAQAFPSIERSKIQASDVLQVESYRSSWGIGRYGGNRGPYIRRHYRNGGYYGDRRYYRHYGNHRRYYGDYDDNFRAAFGGLAAGAIIGGLLAQPRYYEPRYYEGDRRYYRTGGSHADWCYARYRSYRAYDNTFQPYNGGRRQCISPY